MIINKPIKALRGAFYLSLDFAARCPAGPASGQRKIIKVEGLQGALKGFMKKDYPWGNARVSALAVAYEVGYNCLGFNAVEIKPLTSKGEPIAQWIAS
ncbi:MAG: hypothetical protein MJA30_37490 [Cytophagales bacterium]|nr:hypothetical protein [Cytophagales bacterium]